MEQESGRRVPGGARAKAQQRCATLAGDASKPFLRSHFNAYREEIDAVAKKSNAGFINADSQSASPNTRAIRHRAS
jgi:hypothetical protein